MTIKKYKLSAAERIGTVTTAAIDALKPYLQENRKTSFLITRDNWKFFIILKSYPQPLYEGSPMISLSSHAVLYKPHYKSDEWIKITDLDTFESQEELACAVQEAVTGILDEALYTPEERMVLNEPSREDVRAPLPAVFSDDNAKADEFSNFPEGLHII